MNKVTFQANNSELGKVHEFIEKEAEKFNYDPKTLYQAHIITEEIFINISSYAYKPEQSNQNITLCLEFSPNELIITFEDNGIPYNPLKSEDPDISLPVEKRSVGGLGIFMVKHIADSMDYKYNDGKNILKIKKKA